MEYTYYRSFRAVDNIHSDPAYNKADVKMPTRGTKFSAGYDFFAPKDIYVPAHGMTNIVPFNVKAIMPPNEFLLCVVRSSLGCKHGIQLAQGMAIIDSDYAGNPNNDGNIGFCFVNNSDTDYVIAKGERCVQGIFNVYKVTADDTTIAIRDGGYGSTGER